MIDIDKHKLLRSPTKVGIYKLANAGQGIRLYGDRFVWYSQIRKVYYIKGTDNSLTELQVARLKNGRHCLVIKNKGGS